MPRIDMTVTFTDGTSAPRSVTHTVEPAYPGDRTGEDHVERMLATELRVDVGPQAAPKHNATARAWLEFPNRPADFQDYFDIENSQAMWTELANLVMGAEADLILAGSYKALEPAQEPDFNDSAALNRLYYIHDKKMTLLNQAVYALIKVQDLLNRLLHESLGGDLVDTNKPDWEEDNLKRVKVLTGLERKRTAGELSSADFTAITNALQLAKDTQKGDLAKSYRNRLTHHVRPSVDYAMFYAYVGSRLGTEIRSPQGKVIGRRYAVLARPPIQYRFEELHAAFEEYLTEVVAMLQALSEIELLRR